MDVMSKPFLFGNEMVMMVMESKCSYSTVIKTTPFTLQAILFK